MLNWRTLTVRQYQHISAILQGPEDEVDKLVSLVALLHNKTLSQVDNMPTKKFSKLAAKVYPFMLSIPKVEPRASLKVKGRRFIPIFDIGRMRFGQYCEAMTFLKSDEIGSVPIERLHLLGASILQPFDWFRLRPNPSGEDWGREHERRANMLLDAPFLKLYVYVVSFMVSIARFHARWKGLLYLPETEEEAKEMLENIDPFHDRYGWQYNAKLIAEERGIDPEDVWDMSTAQAFSYLDFIKAKNEKLAADAKKHITGGNRGRY